MRIPMSLMRSTVAALLLSVSATALGVTKGAAQENGPSSRPDSAVVARKLADRAPSVRRRAAEELARLAATEHRRLAEGYRVQEKDASVRAALAWALYRMGRDESLYPLVAELGSKKYPEQVVGYLKQLETPAPLYVFLNRVNGNTKIRLLEVLAAVGDAGTLDVVRPFTESLDPGIADAAKFAEREINIRISERPAVEPKRERKVGAADREEPE
jgi:hypothetical protein